ncbi:MAG: hypothetical protein Q9223_007970, partial [Gallowayella weberi]
PVWLAKHHLVKLTGGQANFRRQFAPFEEKLQVQQEYNQSRLDQCKQHRIHPDSLQKMTNEDLDEMPGFGKADDEVQDESDGDYGIA